MDDRFTRPKRVITQKFPPYLNRFQLEGTILLKQPLGSSASWVSINGLIMTEILEEPTETTHTQLTNKQIDFYRENGFLVIDDFLVDIELASWREAVDEAVAQRVSRNDAYHNQRGGDDYYKCVFIQCVNLWKTSSKIKQLVLAPRLGKLAADLAGTKGVRLYHDHAMVKQPWENPTNFHVDNPYDPFYSHQAIMLWIALDNTTVQNGCLYFLPGIHKTSHFGVGGNLG